MANITTIEAGFSYGVLDPVAAERRDTKFVRGSLSQGDNIVMLPQGGYYYKGGQRDRGRARFKFDSIAIDETMITLPNGGVAADLIDPDLSITTSAIVGSAFVAFEINLGAPTDVSAFDLIGVAVSDDGGTGGLNLQYWNDVAWVDFAPAKYVSKTSFDLRFVCGAPGEAPVNAQVFRLVANQAAVSGTVTLKSIELFVETDAFSAGRQHECSPNERPLVLIVTDGHIDIFENGTWLGAARAPTSEARLADTKSEAEFDNVMFFHQDVQPYRLVRLGDGFADWGVKSITFENMPNYDFGLGYTNGVDEVQEIQLYSLANGDPFELVFEGQSTKEIVQTGTGATTAQRIQEALLELPNTAEGLAVTSVSSTVFQITFSGEMGGSNYLKMSGTALDENGYVAVRTVTEGQAPGEPFISDERGWPSFGRIVQSRLIIGGFKSLPTAWAASVIGAPFDLNVELGISGAAMLHELNADMERLTDLVEAARRVFVANKGVCFDKNNILSAEEVPNIFYADAPGGMSAIRPVRAQGAIYYPQAGGQTLRQAAYSEIEQDFLADNASILSAFLFQDPVNMVLMRSQKSLDTDLLIAPMAGGNLTTITVERSQEVAGFAQWKTQGLYRDAIVDAGNELFFLVERTRDGVRQLRLEQYDPDILFDELRSYSLLSPTNVLNGLAYFEGLDVFVRTEDQVLGPCRVVDGQITLDVEVQEFDLGTWIAPVAVDQKISIEEETGSRAARLKRVFGVEIVVQGTTSLAIQVNDGDVTDLPLVANQNLILDEGPLARAHSGSVFADGMPGFTRHGKLTITQTHPGFLTVLSKKKQVKV